MFAHILHAIDWNTVIGALIGIGVTARPAIRRVKRRR